MSAAIWTALGAAVVADELVVLALALVWLAREIWCALRERP